jgi:structural maintenance of chromosome 2
MQKMEKDMVEFKDNKGGKINELKALDFSASLWTSCLPVVQADSSKQKTALQKHAVIVKTQQK